MALLLLAVSAPLIALLCILARRAPGSALSREVHVGKNGRPFTLLRLRSGPPKLAGLPMLWNVLRGELSLVGPRPAPLQDTEDSPRHAPVVRPGVTGFHQVSPDSARPSHKKPEHDAFYLANRTFAFDLWLLWRAMVLVIAHRDTSLRMAGRLWEHDRSWRDVAPRKARAIAGPSTSLLRFRLGLTVVLAALCVTLPAGAWATMSARKDLVAAQGSLTQAHRLATGVEIEGAQAQLSEAADQFKSAQSKLGSWMTLPLRAVPGMNNNLAVPIAIAGAGEDLVAAGDAGIRLLELLPIDGAEGSLFQDGNLDLKAFTAASKPAQHLHTNLQEAKARISASPRGFLFPPVANARALSLEALDEVIEQAEVAAAATQLLPSMFGQDERRTWVVGAENNAELRGRGGYLGTFGLLTANDGQLDLGDFLSVGSLPPLPTPAMSEADPEYVRQYLTLGGISAWPNLMMSPDFPTGAGLLLSSLADVAQIPADGLISIDPIALSYLLEVTGPVEIPDIPEPITADNVVEWTLNRLYFLYDDDSGERREQLSLIAKAVWERIVEGDNVDTAALASALSKAANERHLVLFSHHPLEQDLFEKLELTGGVTDSQNDYLLLLSQNIGESKMDYYLSRDISYSGHLNADGTLTGATTIKITNHAPKGKELPAYITGEHLGADFENGRTRTFLSLFVPQRAQLQQMLRDGKEDSAFQNTTELGKRRLATYVQLGPGETEELTFNYRLPLAVRDGRYHLDVQKQSTVRPDTLAVQIELQDGLSVTKLDGFSGGSALGWEGELTSDVSLNADLHKSFMARATTPLSSLLRSPVVAVFGLGGFALVMGLGLLALRKRDYSKATKR